VKLPIPPELAGTADAICIDERGPGTGLDSVEAMLMLYRPKYEPLIKRLFDDLELMVSRIERNKNLDVYDVVRLTERIPVFSRVNGVTVDCTDFSDDPRK
jgi:hypothetical protein